MAAGDGPRPVEIRLVRSRDALAVAFDNGRNAELPAEFLRVKSPSAEVRGHGPGDAVTVAGKRNVRIAAVEPVGNYAVRIRFDDGHTTGIYSWAYLDELARGHDRIWAEYLADLAAQGLSRDA